MSTNNEKAMRLALEAFKKLSDYPHAFDECTNAIKALEEAIAQSRSDMTWVKPHEWRGLTNDECVEIAARGYPRWLEFAQAVEAKLREKNSL